MSWKRKSTFGNSALQLVDAGISQCVVNAEETERVTVSVPLRRLFEIDQAALDAAESFEMRR